MKFAGTNSYLYYQVVSLHIHLWTWDLTTTNEDQERRLWKCNHLSNLSSNRFEWALPCFLSSFHAFFLFHMSLVKSLYNLATYVRLAVEDGLATFLSMATLWAGRIIYSIYFIYAFRFAIHTSKFESVKRNIITASSHSSTNMTTELRGPPSILRFAIVITFLFDRSDPTYMIVRTTPEYPFAKLKLRPFQSTKSHVTVIFSLQDLILNVVSFFRSIPLLRL